MNEIEIRTFIRQIIQVMQKGAGFTGTQIDDQACDMMIRALDSDLIWSWVYALIGRLWKDEAILVSAGEEVNAAMEAEAISPAMVFAIIQAVMALWKQFRK